MFCIFLSAVNASCPIVSTQDDFNLTEYTRKSWYVHRQQPTNYLPVEDNYCVVATYEDELAQKSTIGVYNYARRGSVTGPNVNSEGRVLCAKIPSCIVPSKLRVNICWLPDFLAGDYWVVAAGPRPGHYDWAIVSGGQPRLRRNSHECSPRGLWFFSRNQIRNDTLIRMQEGICRSKGISASLLHDVTQDGCDYEGMYIK